MTTWNEHHTDPRRSYYLALRREYRYSAEQAYAKVKRADTVVTALQREYHPGALFAEFLVSIWHRVFARLRKLI